MLLSECPKGCGMVEEQPGSLAFVLFNQDTSFCVRLFHENSSADTQATFWLWVYMSALPWQAV